MRGTLRWARADLRARKAQVLISVTVVAGVVTALVIATMLLEGAVNPWQALFARTHGADLVVYLSAGTDTGKLHVGEKSGPYPTTPATLDQHAVKSPVQLTAMPVRLGPVDAPLLVAGTWLRPDKPHGAVVEASFAAVTRLSVGDTIHVRNLDGNLASLQVIGIADTTDQGFYPQWTPGLIWVQQHELTAIEPTASEEVLGIRLPAGSDSQVVAQQISNAYTNTYKDNASLFALQRYTTAQQVEDSMASNDRLVGLLLALFGLIALIAAPCAIANVTAGRVLMHRQDLAMLKALGFTPGQVVRMLLAEQTVLGIVGALAGVGLARLITAPQIIHPPGGAQVGLAPLPASWVTLIAAGTVVTVAVATVIPAWWAGRISPVSAVRVIPPRGHLSLIARIGLLVRLPAPLVLGARDSLTRRLPAVMTIVGVALPMVLITIALSTWSTIDGFTSDPARIGLAAGLTVRQGSYAGSADALIRHVGAGYQGAEIDTVLPGGNDSYTVLAIGDGQHQYRFSVVQGRQPRPGATDEAVAGQGFLDLTHRSVGSWVELTVNGVFMDLNITGKIIYPEQNGDVIAFSQDALTASGNPVPPQFWSVVLKPGLSPAAARDTLLRLSRNELDVELVANPADSLGVVRVVIVISTAIVAIIGLTSLLTATSIGVRDHRHETGVLAAIGLTPRQVMATLVVNTTILTAIGVAAGV
ncbi:MAG TPA: FtsX-like permease family protein, partial [Streptosporangiaceae bacterium]|nr:FtsX-like permease family protein [Streptosporangiaceae bacterium]